jgi:hypothetical protein
MQDRKLCGARNDLEGQRARAVYELFEPRREFVVRPQLMRKPEETLAVEAIDT